MQKSFKHVFFITNKYIVLLTPLIVFSLLSNIYLMISANGKLINLLIALVLSALMLGAFIAGWFRMVKLSVSSTLYEKDPNTLMKEFVPGVGEYFLPSMGVVVNGFLFTVFSLIVSYLACIHFIGDVGVSADAFSIALTSQEALKSFLATLSMEQLEKINAWNMSIFFTIGTVYFLMFLYLPALFFKTKNPFMAFFIGLKDLFNKKIFKSLALYLLIFVLNAIINVLSILLGGNIITNFLMTLLNFYFIALVAVGVFYYYYNNYILPQIGQNVDIEI